MKMVIIIAVTVLVLIGGWYVFDKDFLTDSGKDERNTTQDQTIADTDGEWEIYRNSENGLIVSYPANWYAVEKRAALHLYESEDQYEEQMPSTVSIVIVSLSEHVGVRGEQVNTSEEYIRSLYLEEDLTNTLTNVRRGMHTYSRISAYPFGGDRDFVPWTHYALQLDDEYVLKITARDTEVAESRWFHQMLKSVEYE